MTLQGEAPVESFFKAVMAEGVTSFEHLSSECLEEVAVFARSPPGRTRDCGLRELVRVFPQCNYKAAYGIRPVERELQKPVV